MAIPHNPQLQQQQLEPANPLPPLPEKIDVSVSPSAHPTDGVTSASLKKRSNPHVYHFTKKVTWKGESYLLSIDFPCKDWANLDTDQLKHAADEYAEVFLADLQDQLDHQSGSEDEKIKPGDDIAISFRGEDGYIVYAQSGFDTQAPNAATQKKSLKAAGEASRALSQIINDNIEETDEYPKTLHQRLQTDSLKKLREKAGANKSIKLVDPVQLKQKENNCFLNSAFQLLANDPALREDLRDASNYKKGDQDPLYQAIQGYDQHKSKSEPFELPDLGIYVDKPQDAVLDALNELTKDRFEDGSSLATSSFFPDPVKFDENNPSLSLEKIAQEQNKDKFPSTFNLYVSRATDKGKTTKDLSLNEAGTISLTKDAETKDYDLTSFIVHAGNTTNDGHYVTYTRQGDKYWKLDSRSPVKSVSKEVFLAQAKQGSYFRFCEQKATKTISASTNSPEKGKNTLLEDHKHDLSAYNVNLQIEHGSMKNIPSNFLIIHPSTENFGILHPQIQEVCPNLQAELKTENTLWNLWGYNKPNYKPADRGSLWGHSHTDLFKKETSNILHAPLNSKIMDPYVGDDGEHHVDGADFFIEDVLQYAIKHGHTKLAFPIPTLVTDKSTMKQKEIVKESINWEICMVRAIRKYLEKHPHAPLDIKIVYPSVWGEKRSDLYQEVSTSW